MSEQQSYRQIMKATSLFGGVQVFNILISIVSTKCVALLLGPAGMGVVSLLNSTIGMIGGLTNFGLGTSAVKDVAAAHASDDHQRISKVVTVFKRVIWITGLLGLIVTLMLSSWLSRITFGNSDYTLAFALLSVTLLIGQLSRGQSVVLQGMRQLKYLAKASVIGSLLTLCVTLPIYFIWKERGIVPVIILASIVTFLMTTYYSRKIKLTTVDVSRSETLAEGKSMLQMGFLISMSGLMVLANSYLIRLFIGRTGGMADVGLFSAGFAIVNTYVGLIFSAMSTDYFPRLSAVSHDNTQCGKTINQQAEIALLVLSPLLITFLVFIHWLIVLLYSTKFITIDQMIYWAAIGIFFKSVSWSIAFILLAKSDKKFYFYNELLANIYTLVFNIGGYYLGGLTGLGISFMISYLIYMIQVYFVARLKYEFEFSDELLRIFVVQFGLAVGTFLAVLFLPQPGPYVLGVLLILISGWYSYRELDSRLGLKEQISKLVRK